MNNLKRWLKIPLLAVILLVSPIASAADIHVRIAPPDLRIEHYQERPGYVWQNGYWRWRGNRYDWVRGRYVRYRRGYRWSDGRWENSDRGYYWRSGRWDRDNDYRR